MVTGVMHEGWKFWKAYCINCQMRTEPIKSKQEAIDRWNTRQSDQPPSAVPEFLLEMSKQMQAQPNRMTAHPFWQVRCKRHLPTEQGYNDCGYEIVGDDGVVYRSYDSDEEDLELLLLEDYPEFCEKWCADMENGDSIEDAIGSFDPQQDELPDGLRLVYVQEVEEVVTTHLTESDAKWFIRRKQHDYPKLYTYVASAYWSPQFRQLQDWIIGLTAKQEAKAMIDEQRATAIEEAWAAFINARDAISDDCGREAIIKAVDAVLAGQAAEQSEPSTEVKRSRLYEIAEYLRGLGNDADASHVENCARDMVSMKHEIQTAMRGNKVSIDISTGDDDAVARAFATIIGKQPDIDGSVIWLCELDHYNDDAKPIDSEGEHHD
jgi:hypothetical protein